MQLRREEIIMNNVEPSTLLVRLYADYVHYYGTDSPDYAEAVARAIAALAVAEDVNEEYKRKAD